MGVLLLALLLLSGGVLEVPAPPDGTYSAPLAIAVAQLPLAEEAREGYDRSRFRHWVDDDQDGCSTRVEVLLEEADEPPAVERGCRLVGGRWFSYYDGVSWREAAELDIDHLVPLAEAWDSGASAWTDQARRRYANDLDDRRSLVGVTAGVNRSKADQDPAEWLPERARCRYVAEWVAVKHRWRLSADADERAALAALASACSDTVVTVALTDPEESPPE